MATCKIQKKHEKFVLPARADSGAAGLDFSYCGHEPVVIHPVNPTRDAIRRFFRMKPKSHIAVVSLGCAVELPKGHEMQVRPRSGLAFKHGITVLNSPGTVDESYRGEMKVCLINLGTQPFTVEPGMRICQGVIAKVAKVDLEITDAPLSETERGEGGFGSSGL